jgi:uroporphyrinogen decarboxylase
MAWYEGTDFWTPRSYRALLKPRVAELCRRTHACGVPFRYIITKGWRPLLQDLIDIGIDCLAGVDPVQDRIRLEPVKAELGGRMCLMGGLNAAVSLTQWDAGRIREAVRHALRVLAPGGGFILFPVDNIFDEFPWGNVEVLIDEWRRCCQGPFVP